ncbi:substrate-binding periplasmic protein [Spartinivicinus ruber]|uniref:substrate-binding periplasmic protein n=1 Tax=Spartinivicinus ruber TaxID=2683272 RepID=UPI0013D4615F|nr:transporter substrate-binding domain-containing protein [Spartinivicinus ruber]
MKSFLFIFTITICLNSFADSTEGITYLTEEYPPYNFKDEEGNVVGINVDILVEMFKLLGSSKSRKDIKLQPWVRAYRTTKDTTEKTALFTTSRTTKREELFKWVGPLVGGTTSLIVLKSNPNNVSISSDADFLKYKYAVIRDDSAESLLLARNVPKKNLSYSTKFLSMIKKLQNNQVDAIPYNFITASALMKKNNINPDTIKSIVDIPRPNSKGNHIAFNKSVSDSIILEHQKALEKVLSNEELVESIKKRYLSLN